MAQIGIKLADSSFFPVLSDDQPGRKRVLLSVANSGQPTAQVDLLRRSEEGDQFVGCLVLEGLDGGAADEIALVLAVDEQRTVEANLATGDQYQSLSVNLDQIEMLSEYSLPDEAGGDIEAVGVDDGFEDIDVPELETPGLEDELDVPFSAGELDTPEGAAEFDELALDETGLADLSEEQEPALEAPEEFEQDLAAAPELPDEPGTLDGGIDYAHDEDVGEGQDLDELDEELFGATDRAAALAPEPAPASLSDPASLPDEESAWADAAAEESLEAERGYDDEDFDREPFEDEEAVEPEAPRRMRPLVLAALLLISISIVLLAAFGVFRLLRTEPLPDLRAAVLFLPAVLGRSRR